MIPLSVTRAVVEVLADARTSLGTGFLVDSDRLILTARHVLCGLKQVLVRFPDAEPVAATLVEQGPEQADWALLRAAAVPADTVPVPGGRIGNVATEVVWYGIGYANIRAGQRGAFHGVVRAATPQLELFCEELADQSYEDARGLSGGPCIIDGEAAALIVDVLYRNDEKKQIVTGQVHAIPLADIKPQTVALPTAGGPPLPWELVLVGSLQNLSPADQQIAASTARLANPIEGPRLAQQIARRMINQGVLLIAEVLLQLRAKLAPAVVEQILDLAQTLWVSGAAAHCMAMLVQGKRLGALATDYDWSAKHHLRRAFSTCRDGAMAWLHFVVDVGAHPEPFAEAVVEQTFAVLAQQFKTEKRDVIKRRLETHPLAPATVFVASVPRKDVVEKLHQHFPKLVIVFMSRATPSGGVAGFAAIIEHVTPAPSEEEEARAEALNSDARALLA